MPKNRQNPGTNPLNWQGKGLSARTQTALSCIIQPKHVVSFVSQPLGASFLKGVYESRPIIHLYVGMVKLCYNFLLIYILHPS